MSSVLGLRLYLTIDVGGLVDLCAGDEVVLDCIDVEELG